jgi:hypothetical protein
VDRIEEIVEVSIQTDECVLHKVAIESSSAAKRYHELIIQQKIEKITQHTFHSKNTESELQGPESIQARQVLQIAQEKEESLFHGLDTKPSEQIRPLTRFLPAIENDRITTNKLNRITTKLKIMKQGKLRMKESQQSREKYHVSGTTSSCFLS